MWGSFQKFHSVSCSSSWQILSHVLDHWPVIGANSFSTSVFLTVAHLLQDFADLDNRNPFFYLPGQHFLSHCYHSTTSHQSITDPPLLPNSWQGILLIRFYSFSSKHTFGQTAPYLLHQSTALVSKIPLVHLHVVSHISHVHFCKEFKIRFLLMTLPCMSCSWKQGCIVERCHTKCHTKVSFPFLVSI